LLGQLVQHQRHTQRLAGVLELLSPELPSEHVRCLADPMLDSQGYSLCSDYFLCVYDCVGTDAYCENKCAGEGSYSQAELAEGNAQAACFVQYCQSQCDLQP
jgi:hypothetical protein